MNCARGFKCAICEKNATEGQGRQHFQSIDQWGRIYTFEVCEECFDKGQDWLFGRRKME